MALHILKRGAGNQLRSLRGQIFHRDIFVKDKDETLFFVRIRFSMDFLVPLLPVHNCILEYYLKRRTVQEELLSGNLLYVVYCQTSRQFSVIQVPGISGKSERIENMRGSMNCCVCLYGQNDIMEN